MTSIYDFIFHPALYLFIYLFIYYVKSYSRYINKEEVKKVKYNSPIQYNTKHNTSQNTK